MGLGGWGDGVRHWGGGVLEEYRVHMHTYTHVGTRITVGKKIGNPQIPSLIQPFLEMLPANWMPSRRAVD